MCVLTLPFAAQLYKVAGFVIRANQQPSSFDRDRDVITQFCNHASTQTRTTMHSCCSNREEGATHSTRFGVLVW